MRISYRWSIVTPQYRIMYNYITDVGGRGGWEAWRRTVGRGWEGIGSRLSFEHSRVSDLDNPEASTRIGKTRVIFVQAEMKLCRLFSFHSLFFNS